MITNKTKGNVIVCECCGAVCPTDVMIETADGFVCPTCLDYNYRFCPDCNQYYNIDYMVYVDDINEYVCESCLESYYSYCDHCEEYHAGNARIVYTPFGSEMWCDDCVHEWAFYCDECGDLYHTDLLNYDEQSDLCFCSDCYENRRHSGLIGDYHCGNPNGLKFKGSLEWSRLKGYIGFELEYFTDYPDDLAQAVYDVDGFDIFHFEDDTSVSIELVSQPMTYEFIRSNHERFESIFNAIQENNGTCTDGTGLHVHISRTAFGSTEKERAERIAKLLMLFSGKSYDVMGKLAGRCSHWADSISGNREYIKERAKERGGGHSVAVNLEHKDTIEFRLAKSVNNYSDLLNWLEVLIHIVERSKTIDESTATNFDSWFIKCNSIVQSQLAKHGITVDINSVKKMSISDYEQIITDLCSKLQEVSANRNIILCNLGFHRNELPPVPTIQETLRKVTRYANNIQLNI